MSRQGLANVTEATGPPTAQRGRGCPPRTSSLRRATRASIAGEARGSEEVVGGSGDQGNGGSVLAQVDGLNKLLNSRSAGEQTVRAGDTEVDMITQGNGMDLSGRVATSTSLVSMPSRGPPSLPVAAQVQRQLSWSVSNASLISRGPTTWEDIAEGDTEGETLLRLQATARTKANHAISQLREIRKAMRARGLVPEKDAWDV